MILPELYSPNAEGFIRELQQRAGKIAAQIDIVRPGGDFHDTLIAYRRIITACIAEAEAVHARNLEEVEDDDV